MRDNVWGQLRVDLGTCVRREIGGTTLWIRVSEDEWQIAHAFDVANNSHESSAEAPGGCEDADVAGLDWTRFVTVKDDAVFTQPALPDRPVVILPQSPIVILPGRWGRFYFSVPLWIRFVSQPEGHQVTMVEIPSRRLTSTWFGDMESGEICYSIDSRLLRSLPKTDEDEAFARCEVEIHNGSRERLQFERICVHVEYMHLFAAQDKFWSNRLRVDFKGADQVSQLTYVPGPPPAVSGATVVCEPRKILDRSLLKRSFNLIREITGI